MQPADLDQGAPTRETAGSAGWWRERHSPPQGLERRLGVARVLEAVVAAGPPALAGGRFVVRAKRTAPG